MELFGFGVVISTFGQLGINATGTEVLQSPHLPEETIGNKLLVEVSLQQQSKPMELFGLGGNNEEYQLGIPYPNISFNTPVTTFAGGNNWKQVSCLELTYSSNQNRW
jgi:hypothetical protein